jgi:RHH-type transcriptional regulator, proline utilization regulon repressor / proline dehydrogenase / delta 1-pyrroline-5-carboxylate dehydrogenase
MAVFGHKAMDVRRIPPRPPAGNAGADLEAEVRRLGGELLDTARSAKAGVLSKSFWSDQLLDWSMRDAAFKVQLLRFVDVFPTLRNAEQVHRHLIDYLNAPGIKLPPGMGLGLKAGGLLKGAAARAVTAQVTGMAQKFIAGANPIEALPQLRRLWESGIGFSVDLLGEACVSDEEAAAYRQRYLELIQTLQRQVPAWPANQILEQDHLGAVPRINVSIKISSLYARTNVGDFENSVAGLADSLRPILLAAKAAGALVNFDMEQYRLKDLTIALFERCCSEIDFEAGIAMQAYLRSGPEDAAGLIDWARANGRQVTVRLIKGAYWDYETLMSEQLGWPDPVWRLKWETDACFERMLRLFVDAIPTQRGQGGIKLAVGSHNVRSIAVAHALLLRRGLPPAALEVQMLRGMADELKLALAERQWRVREYVPVGEMIPGMAYLVRRLLENASNDSWLRAGFRDKAPAEVLLAPPSGPSEPSPSQADGHDPAIRHALSAATAEVGDGQPFFNEPLRDFSNAAMRKAFAEAVKKTRVSPVAIDATLEQASAAIGQAASALPTWRDRSTAERAKILVLAAAEMRQRRDELAATIVVESGKIWSEADADVCEAIDFCEFYAREAVALFEPRRLGAFAGELNQLMHQARGVAVVISPWNFPLSICCGMTTAALVCGNSALLKPAEQTPAIARELCEILWRAGVPRDILHFVPGRGETIGAAMVRDPRVALIAFTGSQHVGLDIVAAAGQTPANQPWVKHVVCEMGGKNAIIVDESADLDEAVLGVRQSAFGYCGQKCSAASRVIVLPGIYDAFVRRLVESTRTLVIGDMRDPGADMGPVIDAEASAKIRSYILIGKAEAKLALAIEPPPGLAQRVEREFVGPHIFTDVRPEHRLAREEIFGPVLSVMRAENFDAALALANSSNFKLTGGVFSRTPRHLEQARKDFRVGNLYLNRGITGALVGRQPFGGFGLSGLGTKAGGREYLLQFVNPRSVTENTMRRGFAPDVH